MSKPSATPVVRFERLLSSYQRICIFLLLPPLISAFSCIMALFNTSFGLHLALSVALGLKFALATDASMYCMLLSLGIAGAYVPLTVLSARGKIWPFFVGVGLYFADFVYAFFLLGKVETITFIMQMVLHAVFLGTYALGIVFYYRAAALLKVYSKEILDEK